jgi:hypothetical protein
MSPAGTLKISRERDHHPGEGGLRRNYSELAKVCQFWIVRLFGAIAAECRRG